MWFPFITLQVRSFYSILLSDQNYSGDMEVKDTVVLSSSKSFRYTLNVSQNLVNIFLGQFCLTFFLFFFSVIWVQNWSGSSVNLLFSLNS